MNTFKFGIKPIKIKKSILKENLFPNTMLIMYCVTLFMGYYRIIDQMCMNLSIMVLGVCSIFECILKKGLKRQRPFIFFVIIYCICGLICFIYNRNMDIQELLWPLGFMGIGIILLNYNISYNIGKYIFYITCYINIIMIIFYGGADNLAYYTIGSRNMISMYTTFFFCLFMILAYQNKRNVSTWAIALMVLTNVLGIGRTGVAVAAITVIIFLFNKCESGELKRRNMILLPFVIIVLLLLITIAFFTFHDLIKYVINNFLSRGIASLRFNLWTEYTRKTFQSFLNIMLGANISGTKWLNLYRSNLHNSFFMLHAKYGVVMLAGVFVLLFRSFKESCVIHNGYYNIALFLLIFRMSFDYVAFNGIYDTLLIFFMLYPRYKTRDGNIKRKGQYVHETTKKVMG